MRKFIIEIADTEVYINGERRHYAAKMDKENPDVDLDKKAILSLADEMGYEAAPLFEEMVDRLHEMLDER